MVRFFFGCFSDFAINGAEIAPVIGVKQQKDACGKYLDDFEINPPLLDNGLGGLLDAYPGTLSLVGNEVDRGPNPDGVGSGQGDISSQE